MEGFRDGSETLRDLIGNEKFREEGGILSLLI
jgi:hypothetical protein